MQALGSDITTIEGVRKTINTAMHILAPIDKTFVIERAMYESIAGVAGQDLMHSRIDKEGQGSLDANETV